MTPQSWYDYAARALEREQKREPQDDAPQCQDDYISPRGFLCTLPWGHAGRHEAEGTTQVWDTWARGEGRYSE